MKYLRHLNGVQGVKDAFSFSQSVSIGLRKVPIDGVTTAECTRTIHTADSNNCLAQYCNYDINMIVASVLQNIEENGFSQQTVRVRYVEISLCNNVLALSKVCHYNCCNQTLPVCREWVQLLPRF